MASDFSSAGVFNVNGQWATTVRYEASVEQGALKDVQLRFMNGRTALAGATLARNKARELLGEKNFAALPRVVLDARVPGHEDGSTVVKGELRGKTLELRHVVLPGHDLSQSENAILFESRVRRADEPTSESPFENPSVVPPKLRRTRRRLLTQRPTESSARVRTKIKEPTRPSGCAYSASVAARFLTR